MEKRSGDLERISKLGGIGGGFPFYDSQFSHNKPEDIVVEILINGRLESKCVRKLGLGKVLSRHSNTEEGEIIYRVWCEWMGLGTRDMEVNNRYSLITTTYSLKLGQVISPGNNEPTGCKICGIAMLPLDDVAMIYDLLDKKMVCQCDSQHRGAFHLFHVSCAIRWILVTDWMKKTLMFCPGEFSARITPGKSNFFDKFDMGHKNWCHDPEVSATHSTVGLSASWIVDDDDDDDDEEGKKNKSVACNPKSTCTSVFSNVKKLRKDELEKVTKVGFLSYIRFYSFGYAI